MPREKLLEYYEKSDFSSVALLRITKDLDSAFRHNQPFNRSSDPPTPPPGSVPPVSETDLTAPKKSILSRIIGSADAVTASVDQNQIDARKLFAECGKVPGGIVLDTALNGLPSLSSVAPDGNNLSRLIVNGSPYETGLRPEEVAEILRAVKAGVAITAVSTRSVYGVRNEGLVAATLRLADRELGRHVFEFSEDPLLTLGVKTSAQFVDSNASIRSHLEDRLNQTSECVILRASSASVVAKGKSLNLKDVSFSIDAVAFENSSSQPHFCDKGRSTTSRAIERLRAAGLKPLIEGPLFAKVKRYAGTYALLSAAMKSGVLKVPAVELVLSKLKEPQIVEFREDLSLDEAVSSPKVNSALKSNLEALKSTSSPEAFLWGVGLSFAQATALPIEDGMRALEAVVREGLVRISPPDSFKDEYLKKLSVLACLIAEGGTDYSFAALPSTSFASSSQLETMSSLTRKVTELVESDKCVEAADQYATLARTSLATDKRSGLRDLGLSHRLAYTTRILCARGYANQVCASLIKGLAEQLTGNPKEPFSINSDALASLSYAIGELSRSSTCAETLFARHFSRTQIEGIGGRLATILWATLLSYHLYNRLPPSVRGTLISPLPLADSDNLGSALNSHATSDRAELLDLQASREVQLQKLADLRKHRLYLALDIPGVAKGLSNRLDSIAYQALALTPLVQGGIQRSIQGNVEYDSPERRAKKAAGFVGGMGLLALSNIRMGCGFVRLNAERQLRDKASHDKAYSDYRSLIQAGQDRVRSLGAKVSPLSLCKTLLDFIYREQGFTLGGGVHLLGDAILNRSFDCDTSAYLVADILNVGAPEDQAVMAGTNLPHASIVLVPGHAFLKIGSLYLETAQGTLYGEDEFHRLYNGFSVVVSNRRGIAAISVAQTSIEFQKQERAGMSYTSSVHQVPTVEDSVPHSASEQTHSCQELAFIFLQTAYSWGGDAIVNPKWLTSVAKDCAVGTSASPLDRPEYEALRKELEAKIRDRRITDLASLQLHLFTRYRALGTTDEPYRAAVSAALCPSILVSVLNDQTDNKDPQVLGMTIGANSMYLSRLLKKRLTNWSNKDSNEVSFRTSKFDASAASDFVYEAELRQREVSRYGRPLLIAQLVESRAENLAALGALNKDLEYSIRLWLDPARPRYRIERAWAAFEAGDLPRVISDLSIQFQTEDLKLKPPDFLIHALSALGRIKDLQKILDKQGVYFSAAERERYAAIANRAQTPEGAAEVGVALVNTALKQGQIGRAKRLFDLIHPDERSKDNIRMVRLVNFPFDKSDSSETIEARGQALIKMGMPAEESAQVVLLQLAEAGHKQRFEKLKKIAPYKSALSEVGPIGALDMAFTEERFSDAETIISEIMKQAIKLPRPLEHKLQTKLAETKLRLAKPLEALATTRKLNTMFPTPSPLSAATELPPAAYIATKLLEVSALLQAEQYGEASKTMDEFEARTGIVFGAQRAHAIEKSSPWVVKGYKP